MKIIVKELDRNGEIISEKLYLSFKDASKETGLRSSNIYRTMKKQTPIFFNRSEGRIFFIQEEKDQKLCLIDGEEIQSFFEIKEKFEINPTIFLNQISKKKNFLDENEISHSVSSFSPELEKMIDNEKKQEMINKILSKTKEGEIKNNYDVFSKRNINVSDKKIKKYGFNLNNIDLLKMDQNSLATISKR